MSLNPVHKGKRGEVEFCQWLDKNLGIDAEREYNQSQGGADIIINDFIFEVKRRETLNLKAWWKQVTVAANNRDKNLIPVVCFRQNRKPWEFLLSASLIGPIDEGFIRLNENVFIEFAKTIIDRDV